MKTLHLPGFDFPFTPAIQVALQSIDVGVLSRSHGGFGQSVRYFVPLKTARRLADELKLATISAKGGGSIALNDRGLDALLAVKKATRR
jgi:hypothetical protein